MHKKYAMKYCCIISSEYCFIEFNLNVDTILEFVLNQVEQYYCTITYETSRTKIEEILETIISKTKTEEIIDTPTYTVNTKKRNNMKCFNFYNN